ncbi:MAG: hypothetical protein Q8Q62_07720 [Mesorhizobium sp.]|nr:hypothetical protein [Mesorhizobium sp.]
MPATQPDPTASPEPSKAGAWRRRFGSAPKPARPGGESGARRKYTVGDGLMVAGGIALGLTCAFFPWYVFFNQDQFGIRAIKFGGNPGTGTQPATSMPTGHIDAPVTVPGTAAALDAISTGTLPDKDPPRDPPGLAEQPFPAPEPAFALVHIANGRAMIEDDKGLWVVQPGSVLPDNTRVTSIEQRGGQWVLVTTGGRVVEIAR